jgi:hypothetical protein
MQRWLYLVRLDEEYDLLSVARVGKPGRFDPVRAAACFRLVPAALDGQLGDLPHVDAVRDGLLKRPTPAESAAWVGAVYAMRSVARRVMGHRPRGAGKGAVPIAPLEADAVVRRHVGLCRPDLRASAKPLRSFDRMRLEPVVPEKVRCFGDGARVFWQMVFASMMPGFGVAVCSD